MDDLTRTRQLLATMQTEQAELWAALEQTGLTGADAADWLLDHRTPDQKLAHRRLWLARGLRDIEPPIVGHARQLQIAVAAEERIAGGQVYVEPTIDDDIRRLWMRDMDDKQIAHDLGLSTRTILRHRTVMGLRPNSKFSRNNPRDAAPAAGSEQAA